MQINPIQLIGNQTAALPTVKETPSQFGSYLNEAMQSLNEVQQATSTARKDLAVGKADLHQVMIQSEESSIAMQLAIEVRNKAVEAYQEMMRMQV
ncbi:MULTISPECIES: flagellar hook-basal body complex protein FliE [unclassified Exiguobacterium]|uniref:flagellar hook-basal body complex protein FliE n=1 Tax=unclassified Exiguobacterium TaxID=2644629 RepID=UPI0003532D1D|nr:MULTISPECIES: flagellar hook-basal body complex protein FliE [unclassified Exiguobacterium]EPE63097.1 flagellar hook-basal body complex protein FliE [Exiguobacterium sp. S17]OGX77965.1 flagellar hook-basal body complex protein FliE [Exiguobacterium sp. SH31]TCI37355.1 flagellar hook-basal body complex protein FliE [Exiguobacterium sp. SH4S7]TCI45485.1 flagellar hook-basal body complex protein FliE [Exiguobacterium sp. SH5S32]TCI52686.1 flagellar hook-basal body complex protein FliE [Exiguob